LNILSLLTINRVEDINKFSIQIAHTKNNMILRTDKQCYYASGKEKKRSWDTGIRFNIIPVYKCTAYPFGAP